MRQVQRKFRRRTDEVRRALDILSQVLDSLSQEDYPRTRGLMLSGLGFERAIKRFQHLLRVLNPNKCPRFIDLLKDEKRNAQARSDLKKLAESGKRSAIAPSGIIDGKVF